HFLADSPGISENLTAYFEDSVYSRFKDSHKCRYQYNLAGVFYHFLTIGVRGHAALWPQKNCIMEDLQTLKNRVANYNTTQKQQATNQAFQKVNGMPQAQRGDVLLAFAAAGNLYDVDILQLYGVTSAFNDIQTFIASAANLDQTDK